MTSTMEYSARARWYHLSKEDKLQLIAQLGMKGTAEFFGKSVSFMKTWYKQNRRP